MRPHFAAFGRANLLLGEFALLSAPWKHKLDPPIKRQSKVTLRNKKKSIDQ